MIPFNSQHSGLSKEVHNFFMGQQTEKWEVFKYGPIYMEDPVYGIQMAFEICKYYDVLSYVIYVLKQKTSLWIGFYNIFCLMQKWEYILN